MTLPLHPTSPWIESTLDRMTTEQRIGQLLNPIINPKATREEIEKTFAGIEPGSVTMASGSRELILACTANIQSLVSVPALVAADLENGPNRIILDASPFPDAMSIGAANNPGLAYLAGQSAAAEGRAAGIHCCLGPVVDINANPENPITNTRSLGDHPERIAALSTQLIHGMQEHGLMACAKHFPGDGYDNRDQHLCTTVNPLRMEEWFRLSGRMFKAAIDAGVWSIMIGHIALPAWDAGDGRSLNSAPPATLSRKLVTDLLRGELAFTGLIMMDALGMGGVTSHARTRKELILTTLDAGADILLLANMADDFSIIKQALAAGELPMERLNASVRRFLAVKERLGLHEDANPRTVSDQERQRFARAAQDMADLAITVVTDTTHALPIGLQPGSKIFSMHVLSFADYHVNGIDDLLRARGFEVTSFIEEGTWDSLPSRDALAGFDAILVHFVYGPTWGTGRIRPNGAEMRNLALLYGMHLPRLISISYGSPYICYEFPAMPVYINAYSPDVSTQQAVLRLLLGEIVPAGSSPVDLSSPYRHLAST